MTFNKIKILPDFISNKIAAGEVVQRPESVVKELMENSIDANAKTIEVIVKRAGKVLIQVIDDGEGMSEEDVVASLHRHATSKISTFEDLDSIKTLGFRGEALSSIAAVSNVEIKTETKEDEIGTLVRVEDDSNIIKEKGSYAKGTSIAVKNLFYNTPARRNFLKSNATELRHILDTFKRIALSHHELNFKFWNDDDLIFDFPAGSIEDRMKSIFADNILDAVVEVKEITDYISLSGFVGKPKFLSKSRGEQYFFINKRYVSNKTVSHAVFTSYENILEKGSYPFFVLFLDLDPAKVNVNVHPSKLEIKFDDEKNIYSYVQAVVKKSLGSFDLVPAMSFDPSVEEGERLRYDNLRKIDKNDFSDRPEFNSRSASGQRRENIFSEEEIDVLFSSINPEIKRDSSGGETSHPFEDQGDIEIYHSKDKDAKESSKKTDSGLTFIVSLQNKYILSPIKSGLMIIDQHVAHERILYEKVLKLFRSNMPVSQQLLFSQTLHVDPADYEMLKELNPHLQKIGFEIKFFSKDTIVIDGVPPDVKVGREIETLKELLEEFKKNQREKELDILNNIAASFSCKAAIKAGDKLDEREMRVLVDQLFATSMPYVCPHGRPIVIKIPLEEFDKRFGRT